MPNLNLQKYKIATFLYGRFRKNKIDLTSWKFQPQEFR